MGDMSLEYGNEKRVCTRFDVVLAFFVSVLIVLKFVGEYGLILAARLILQDRISEEISTGMPL